jgi:hypothetical protein
VSANNQNSGYPAGAAIGAQGLWAAWLENDGASSVIKGSYNDGAGWGSIQALTPSALITVGPGLVSSPGGDSVLLSYYLGSQPTYDSTWGIYTVAMDTAQPASPRLACPAPSLGVADFQMATNGAGRPGIFFETGYMIGSPGYIAFLDRPDTVWTDTVTIATSWEFLPYYARYVSEPRLAAAQGDTYSLAYYLLTEQNDTFNSQVVVALRGPGTTLAIGAFPGQSPMLAYNPYDQRLWLSYEADISGLSVAGVRSYTRADGWSGLQVLDSTASSFRLACDTLGYVWSVYVSGGSIIARYAWRGDWSAPETVAIDTAAVSPFIVSDNTGRTWVLWARSLGGQLTQIMSAYRDLHPGVAEWGKVERTLLQFKVSPSVSATGFTISWVGGRAAARNLAIHDAAGRLVRELRLAGTGQGTTVWDGRDGAARLVPCGCYFVTLETGGTRRPQKVLVMRQGRV